MKSVEQSLRRDESEQISLMFAIRRRSRAYSDR